VEYAGIAVLVAIVAGGCGGGSTPASTAPPAAAPAATKPAFGTFGVDLATRKTAVKPGDDFFANVNGTWLDTFAIPADKASYGVAEVLDDEARANVRKIIEDSAAAKAAPGTVEQKIGDYYASFMDTARIESAGIGALKADLDRIAAAKTPSDLSRLFGEPGVQSPIGVYVGPDDKNPDAYFVNLVQSGLGLPDRDYYLKDDPKLKRSARLRCAHRAHADARRRVRRPRQGHAHHGARDAHRPRPLGGREDARRHRQLQPEEPRRRWRPMRRDSTGRRCSTRSSWRSGTVQPQHARRQ
jgi:putative endopeptidase